MQTQRINISLPNDVARDLRRTIPERSRSKFIAEVLKEKLKRKRSVKKEFIASLKANRKYDEQIAKEWSALEVEAWPD